MMRKIKIQNTDHSLTLTSILFSIALFIFIPNTGFCSDYTGNCSVTVGSLMTTDKFSNAFNIDKEYEMGVSFDLKKKNWPISFAFDSSFLYASSETSSNSYNIEERKDLAFFRSDLGLGVKKFFDFPSVVKPFISSGVYLVRIYGKMADKREIVAGIGYWIGAGFYFDLSKNFICGVQWKKSKADINMFNSNFNVGGDHFALMAGVHF